MLHPLVITRPAGAAQAWQAALQPQLHGRACHVLPLIHITPRAASLLRPYWQALDQWQAVLFVSPAAVAHFFAAQPDARQRWQALAMRAWAVGPGTRRALLDAGVPANLIDSPPDEAPQFDSEALWPWIQPQLAQAVRSGKKILRVRGTDQPATAPSATDAGGELCAGQGRDWLECAMQQAGVGVHSVAAYCRQAPVWDAEQTRAAHVLAGAPAVWLFSSGLAVQYLADQFPDRDWAHASALATHARIAQRAQALGFGRVLCCRPTVDDMEHSLQFCP